MAAKRTSQQILEIFDSHRLSKVCSLPVGPSCEKRWVVTSLFLYPREAGCMLRSFLVQTIQAGTAVGSAIAPKEGLVTRRRYEPVGIVRSIKLYRVERPNPLEQIQNDSFAFDITCIHRCFGLISDSPTDILQE